MRLWYFVISSTRRFSSVSLLSSYLNLYLIFFFFFPTSNSQPFLEPETLSASPTKKRNTILIHLVVVVVVVSFPFLFLQSPRRPHLSLDKASRPPKHATDIACGLVAHGLQLVYHSIPVALNPAYLHELGATSLSTQSTVGSRSLSQSLDHTCLSCSSSSFTYPLLFAFLF